MKHYPDSKSIQILSTKILTNGDRLLKLLSIKNNNENYYVLVNRNGYEIINQRFNNEQHALMEYYQVYELRISHKVGDSVSFDRAIFNDINKIKKTLNTIYNDGILFDKFNDHIEATYKERNHNCLDTIELLQNGNPINKNIWKQLL